MQGRPDNDPFADLLSGFSTPAPQDGSSVEAKRDSDVFDLFGPTPPLASSGDAGPSLSSQRPSAQQILGSRTSSAAAYEDALSHGFTPETTASLLDFDTPMASPTSPGAHQAWLPAPSQLGRSCAAVRAKESPDIQQPPTSASREPTSGSFRAQPAPDAAALARPETHMLESSGGISAAIAQQDQRTRPALLSQASMGLSLSDAGTSASVLSSLDAASDMDADMEPEAHAAGLAAPAASSPRALQSPEASSPGEIQPHRNRVPSSPFQGESDADSTSTRLMPGRSTQAASSSKAGTSMHPDEGPAKEPERAQTQPVLSSSGGLSWQERDEQPLQAAPGPEPVPSIRGASSDLMEAWNEQENLAGSQSRRPSQMQERLSLGESDLMLDELEELEQASSMLEGLVGTAEAAQQPQHSSSAAPGRPEPLPTLQAAGQQPGTQAAAFVEAAAASSRQPSTRQAAESTAELPESSASAENALADQHDEQQGLAAARQLSSAPSENVSSTGLGPPSLPDLSESAQPASMLAAAQAGFARPGSTQTPTEAILRPADDAFREASTSPTAEDKTVVEDVAPPGHSSQGHIHSESDQPQQTWLASAFTAAAGAHSSEQQQQRQQQDLEQHSMGDVTTPRMRDAVGAAMPHSSVAQAATTAGPQEGPDLLARAEALERALATGNHSKEAEGLGSDPLLRVRQRLAPAGSDWPPGGGPGPRGSTVGGSLCLRADGVAALQQAATSYRTHGAARVIACFHGVVAVGMSGGAAFVLLPRGLSAEGSPEVMKLGEPRPGDDAAVSALAFSPLGNVLAVGHANGDIAFWELRRAGWECGKVVKDAHVTTVVACTFLEGSSSTERSTALSSDSRGRLVFHNVTGYLSITNFIAGRLAKSTQQAVLLDGRQLGPLCHLAALRLPPKGPAKVPADDAARQLFFQEGGSPFDGLVLMCTAKSAYVGRVLPEGRLVLLHNMPRPPDTPQGSVPYAAWRASPAQPAGKRAAVVAALAWDRQLLLLDVPLTRPADEAPADGRQTGADSASQQAAITPSVTQKWNLDHPVIGVAWLEGPSLAVIQEQGTRTLIHLYNQQGTQLRGRMDLDDSLIPNQHLVLPGSSELSYTSSLASAPERMMLLTTQGVRAVRLMTWQERLATLRDLGRWDHALLMGLTLLDAAQAEAGLSAAPALLLRGGRLGGRGSDAKAIEDALWTLVLGYLDASLAGLDAGTVQEETAAAAETAVDVCLGLKRNAQLWQDVAPRFQRARAMGPLLGCLLPRVLAGQLQSLAPEIMQALVEQCAAAGKVADVERCVLRLDLATLDFNQVTRLCRTHQLHSALAFLFTRALSDYAAPAAELLLAHAHGSQGGRTEREGGRPGDWGARTPTGYKLLVYLRCGLCGEAFPPGTGEIPADIQATVKLQLLALLLFSTLESAHRLAAAFGGGDGDYSADEAAEALLPGPHAALRCLIRLDAGATLKILREALDSWDATESDLAEAASIFMEPPSASVHSACTATQAVVDALIKIIEAEGQQSGFRGSATAAMPASARASALAFVAAFVTAGRATVRLRDAVPILECLAQDAGGHTEETRSSQEQSFAAVLLSAVGGGRSEPGAEADGVLRRALQLARAAGFLQPQAQVFHSMGNYKQALQCYIEAENHPEAAFRYIDAAINGGPSVQRVSHTRLSAFKATVMEAMSRLVELDSAATAGIMLSSFPQEHAAAVKQLQGSPLLQYKYLKSALQETAARAEQAAESPSKTASEAAAAGAHEALLAQAGVGELYVRLLCQFEPAAALPFLQSHDAYRVEEVLPVTERFGVADAQGYLLERLGDVTSALSIYCDAADRANNELVAAILAGNLPLESLPIPAQTRLARAGSVPDTSEGQSNLARLFANGTAENRAVTEGKGSSSGLPRLLADAQAALKGAVSMCKRHSRDAAASTAQELWFTVLQRYVALLRQLRHLARQRGNGSSAAQQTQRLESAQDCLTAFMEDIISHMAGYVPLKAIAERILLSYASDPFGDFKGTLVGLLAAFSYELSILQTASRLTSADAFRTLHALYRERTHPVVASYASAAPGSRGGDGEDAGAMEEAESSSQAAKSGPRRRLAAGMLPTPCTPQAHRLQLLSDINSGSMVVNSRSMGLVLAPAAEKVRSPPPPALAASVPPGARPRSGQPSGQERAALPPRTAGGLAGSGPAPLGALHEPQSPVHRGGVDVNYLRLHDLHL